jgi:uncharacterized membrane protein YkvA (DUF1232 family)
MELGFIDDLITRSMLVGRLKRGFMVVHLTSEQWDGARCAGKFADIKAARAFASRVWDSEDHDAAMKRLRAH